MIGPRFPAAVLAAILVASIFLSGCTGSGGGSQPPASTVTAPVQGTATTLPETTPTGIPYTPPTTPVWVPGTVVQGEGTILIQGDVTGLKSARGNFIEEVRFTVIRAPRAESVTFEVPNTQIVFTKYGVQFGTNYEILSGDRNGDHILDEGEAFLVRVFIQPPNELYPGQTFIMAIKTPYPQVTVTAEAPPVITNTVVLATAP